MAKFEKGERVRVVEQGQYHGLTGTVISPCLQMSHIDWPQTEILVDQNSEPGAVRGFLYFDDEDLELADDPYEYAVQRVYGHAPQRIGENDWRTKKVVEAFSKAEKEGFDPIWGKYILKVVKRRKAGPIEDV